MEAEDLQTYKHQLIMVAKYELQIIVDALLFYYIQLKAQLEKWYGVVFLSMNHIHATVFMPLSFSSDMKGRESRNGIDDE